MKCQNFLVETVAALCRNRSTTANATITVKIKGCLKSTPVLS